MVPQTSYKIIFALLFGITILETFAQTSPRFVLVSSFTEGSNEILFKCRDEMTTLPYPSALFWLNGTNLADQATVSTGTSGGEIEFIITRQLGGNYTCGKLSPDGLNREESIPEAYVAYPEDDPSLPTEFLHYEESGTTARLECAIKPGVLTTEYFVTWKNASSGVNLINLVKGSLQSQYRTDTRYTVAQNDFSLLIEDVKPSDAGMYLCVLGVSGAQRFSVPEEYDQTKRINLTLQVFDPPMIIDLPRPVRVALPDTSDPAAGPDVTYNCTATAADSYANSLELLWRHNEVLVGVTRNSNKYSTNVLSRESSMGLTRVTVELTIRSPGLSDSGTVQCIARIPPRVDTNNMESRATADTTLSVLGGFSNMDVSITDDGAVLYDLQLLESIPTDVRLRLEYTDANDESNQMNVTTEGGFVNTTRMLHVVRKLPFQVFQVRVAMATPDLAVIGPFHPKTQTLDVRNTPLTRDELIATVVTVCFGVFLITIVFTIIFLTYCLRKYCTNKHTKKGAHDAAEKILDSEIKNDEGGATENNADKHAKRFVQIYTMIYKGMSACDDAKTQGEPGDIEMQLVQEEMVDVEDVMICLDKVLGYGLRLEQSGLFKECLMKNIQRIHDSDKSFVIETFKTVFNSVYSNEYVIGQEPIRGEELELLVRFVEATLKHVLKDRYLQQTFEPVISGFVPKISSHRKSTSSTSEVN